MTNTNRREFIKGAGGYGATAAFGLAGGASLGRSTKQAEQAQHPFGYPEAGLDVEKTRELGYVGFQGITLSDGNSHGGCAFGAFNAIIGQLAAVVGEPYTRIPLQMMDWGGAGVVGYGTLCGTLTGTAAAIGLICSGNDARAFISDLMSWYSDAPLPTNRYAPTGDLPQSKAESNLCHVSLTRWCTTSGYASGSPERVDRCSRLSGDVAAKAVEMLNSSALGLERPSERTVCRACHYMGPSYAVGQFTHGDMNCLTCHINLKEKDVTVDGHGAVSGEW